MHFYYNPEITKNVFWLKKICMQRIGYSYLFLRRNFVMLIGFTNKTLQIKHAPCNTAAEGAAHLYKIVVIGNRIVMLTLLKQKF